MTNLRAALSLALALAACASPATSPSPAAAPEPASSAVTRPPDLIPNHVEPPVVDFAAPPDFEELRIEFGRREDFALRCERREDWAETVEALEAGESEAVVTQTDALLARCPVDAFVHHWRSLALRNLGLELEAEMHDRWLRGLIESILATGDGQSENSPWVTISIREEYAVLSYLGFSRKSQSLVNGASGPLDLLTVEKPGGESASLYFNPSLHFLRLYHQFK